MFFVLLNTIRLLFQEILTALWTDGGGEWLFSYTMVSSAHGQFLKFVNKIVRKMFIFYLQLFSWLRSSIFISSISMLFAMKKFNFYSLHCYTCPYFLSLWQSLPSPTCNLFFVNSGYLSLPIFYWVVSLFLFFFFNLKGHIILRIGN